MLGARVSSPATSTSPDETGKNLLLMTSTRLNAAGVSLPPWGELANLIGLLSSPGPHGFVVGTSSPLSPALWLSQEEVRFANGRPHLVVVADSTVALRVQESFALFNHSIKSQVLPGFDVGVYSNLYPNRAAISQRVAWMHAAQNARPGDVFIAPLAALLQRTLPFDALASRVRTLKIGDALDVGFNLFLDSLGYISTPLVEDLGSYSVRGGIVDVFSPTLPRPVRLELFGDMIESIREFDPDNQRSLENLSQVVIVPAHEVIITDENRQQAAIQFKESVAGRAVDPDDVASISLSLSQGRYFHGIEFLLSYFYKRPANPLEHFSADLNLWKLDPMELARTYDNLHGELKFEFEESAHLAIRPHYSELYSTLDGLQPPPGSKTIDITKIKIQDGPQEDTSSGSVDFSTQALTDLIPRMRSAAGKPNELFAVLGEKLEEWRGTGYRVFIFAPSSSQAQRLRLFLEKSHLHALSLDESIPLWASWVEAQDHDPNLIHILPFSICESLRLTDEKIVFLRDEDIFGRRPARRESRQTGTLEQRARSLNFGDLKVGDYVVHKQHGIGVYDGLRVMPIQGVEAEFIQLKYRDGDKLYLPVYRVGQIQKYSSPGTAVQIDRLGGAGWEKTKTKVKSHLRDVASELLNLYALRSQTRRPPFSPPDEDLLGFESTFPYEETDDQLRAIGDVIKDLTGDKPMDRLICGDVGFGKTEVAMRAAFKVAQEGRQVALIAPTTVLTFQHFENFKKRFQKWPLNIRALNRFVPKAIITETLAGLKDGSVDIVIGTHRLLSNDVAFKNLGLMIVDEEQKFGVRHKERLKKIKAAVDTLSMSATPIPRTLNMSLMGIRDLSIINTPPVDRLPTRTFVCRFDAETIRKAVMSEVARGGQVFFIHNRIQSIYELADRLREILPDLRMRVAHGQVEEGELEKTMVAFFHHEVDILICTAIVESGMDIPKANTMFIDNAHQFGLSQLYQLRGRVGRSKERAYCYLLIPPDKKIDAQAQERLKVIQENTALGSGFKIAHYDLELRGAGDLLGEEQSGHINAVGYELYLELLDEAVHEARGEPHSGADLEPEINVRIPALIPDNYISDIRTRLSFYKALSEIQSLDEIDRIESDLRDQFGKLPEPVLNLLGLMGIRKLCKDLGVRDLSSGQKSISLAFTSQTPLSTAKAIQLASRSDKKYSITPDSRLNIRMNEITWPRIFDELQYLLTLC